MRKRLTFITGFSALYMILGLILSFTDADSFLNKRFFFTTFGIMGWFIGNKLIELDERLQELGARVTEPKSVQELPPSPSVAS